MKLAMLSESKDLLRTAVEKYYDSHLASKILILLQHNKGVDRNDAVDSRIAELAT